MTTVVAISDVEVRDRLGRLSVCGAFLFLGECKNSQASVDRDVVHDFLVLAEFGDEMLIGHLGYRLDANFVDGPGMCLSFTACWV